MFINDNKYNLANLFCGFIIFYEAKGGEGNLYSFMIAARAVPP